MMMKIYAIGFFSKSHNPFQSYHLTGPANELLVDLKESLKNFHLFGFENLNNTHYIIG